MADAIHKKGKNAMILTAAVLTSVVLSAAQAATPRPSQTCLHETGTETPEQQQRRRAAVGAARAINTLESRYAAANGGTYARAKDLQTLAVSTEPGQISYSLDPQREVVPGFKLTLDVLDKGYWFEIRDTMDPCGFRVISNQGGVIFNAHPLQ